MKQLPIGVSTFEKLIKNNYVYVDKTAILHTIVTTGEYYFLSRPRRFGKSLTISTLAAIFSGEKELFANLAIGKTDYEWPVHPVMHIDFAEKTNANPDELLATLRYKVNDIAQQFNIVLPENLAVEHLFEQCIRRIKQQAGVRVVLLIDEYDKPITDHLDNPKLADKMRDVLGSFYGVIKGNDDYLKLVFITGVSRFSRASIFSRLNNLEDITTDKAFASIVGYTEQELLDNFDDHINTFAVYANKSKNEIIDQLRYWYDGYCFHPDVVEKLYSPQAVMQALKKQEFNNYWLSTGATSFVVKLVERNNYPLVELENARITELEMLPDDAGKLKLTALLLQSGYLTIKGRDEGKRNCYVLGYPNGEIREAFISHVAAELLKKDIPELNDGVVALRKALDAGDVDDVCKQMYTFFAGILFKMSVEKHYHLVFYALFSLVGADIIVEGPTNIGSIDATVETDDKVFIFELKRNASAKKALQQIIEKQYAEKFVRRGKKIILVGLAFSNKKRNLSGWLVQEYSQ